MVSIDSEREPRGLIFGMALPSCLVKAIDDGTWASLAKSPKIEEVFGEAPVRASFYSLSAMVAMTKWWREELDEETLECYYGTSSASVAAGYISRMGAVIVAGLGPDLIVALEYDGPHASPSVVFLGQQNHWRKISENVCDLIYALDSERSGA